MENLWHWLMRANAKGVFVAALGALLLATGWWVREEIRSRDEPLGPVTGQMAAPVAKDPIRLTVLDAVQRQLAIDPTWVPDTPFRPALGDRRRRPDEPREDLAATGEDTDTSTRSPPPRGGGISEPRPAGAGAGSETGEVPIESLPDGTPRPTRSRPIPGTEADHMQFVTLVYRGIFTRSDGTQVALIEDAERGRRRFHPVGSDLYGLKLESADTAGIRIVTADGEGLDLPIGHAMHFSEGMPLE